MASWGKEMEYQYPGGGGSGSWPVMPTVPPYVNSPSSSQEHMFLQQQQQLQQQFHNQQQQNPMFYHFQQHQQHQPQLQQQLQQHQNQLQQQQLQKQQHQQLASHFNILPLMENLARAIETENADHNFDSVINELNTYFENCQQLLNSMLSSLGTKAVTFEGQKKKLEESQQLLKHRKDRLSQYRASLEESILPQT